MDKGMLKMLNYYVLGCIYGWYGFFLEFGGYF